MNLTRAIIISGLIWAVMLAGCVSDKTSKAAVNVLLEPSPVPVVSFKVSGKEFRFEKEGLVIVVAYLDQGGLESYYSGQGMANPFGVIYPLLRPTVFLARIENHSLKPVLFNPSFSGMVDDDGKPYVNRDLTDFYAYLEEGVEREGRMAALRATLFDTSIRLAPGSSAERLLVYDALGEGVKAVKLILREVYVDQLAVDIPFLFICRYR